MYSVLLDLDEHYISCRSHSNSYFVYSIFFFWFNICNSDISRIPNESAIVQMEVTALLPCEQLVNL